MLVLIVRLFDYSDNFFLSNIPMYSIKQDKNNSVGLTHSKYDRDMKQPADFSKDC